MASEVRPEIKARSFGENIESDLAPRFVRTVENAEIASGATMGRGEHGAGCVRSGRTAARARLLYGEDCGRAVVQGSCRPGSSSRGEPEQYRARHGAQRAGPGCRSARPASA